MVAGGRRNRNVLHYVIVAWHASPRGEHYAIFWFVQVGPSVGQKLLDEFRAKGDVARSVGAIAAKIVASTVMGLLVATARAAGIEL
jgi:hypothetical protein